MKTHQIRLGMNEKNKIVHVVCSSRNGEETVNILNAVSQLAIAQNHHGFVTEIWYVREAGRPFPIEILENIRIREFRQRRGDIDKELKDAILDEMDPVVFNLHGRFIYTNFLLSEIFGLLDVPFVFTPHGTYEPDGRQIDRWRKKLYFKLIEKKIIQRSGNIAHDHF